MSPQKILLGCLYFFIVLVILPIFCSNKVYSIYYQESPELNEQIEKTNNELRKREATEYLLQKDVRESLTYHESKLSEPVDNLVIVIAKHPAHEEDLTLTQLVTQIDENIKEQKFFRNAMMICNATRISFKELNDLSKYYPVWLAENATTKWKLFNTEEVQKHDFVECLSNGLRKVNFKHVTLIRDMVLPYSGFLKVVNQVTSHRLTSSIQRGELRMRDTSWLFLHLHEPVPFRHYELTYNCVIEILMLTFAGGLLFYVVFGWLEGPHQPSLSRITYVFYGALYFLTFALVLGRPYVSELRRLSAGFYRVYGPPEPVRFSTMALPNSTLPFLLDQLRMIQCSTYHPFHRVLNQLANTFELPGYVISPSLFRYVSKT